MSSIRFASSVLGLFLMTVSGPARPLPELPNEVSPILTANHLRSYGIGFKAWHSLVFDSLPSHDSSDGFEPLALVTGDFNEDGIPDLVSSFGQGSQGFIGLQGGQVDSFYPLSSGVGEPDNAPFSTEIHWTQLEQRAELLGAGDFDGDGHWDLVAGRLGNPVLEFLLGNGRGAFSDRRSFALPGLLTALLVSDINRADGLRDVVLGLEGAAEFFIYVLEGRRGAITAEPEIIEVSGRIRQLVFGQFDKDYPIDLAAAVADRVVVLHGRDRRLTYPQLSRDRVAAARVDQYALTEEALGLAELDILHDSRAELAVLTQSGKLEILTRNRDDRFELSNQKEGA